jgi:hypothetical protein
VTFEPLPSSSNTDNWYVSADFAAVAKQFLGEHAQFGLQCARSAHDMWQGGNQWSGWAAVPSFLRHVCKLNFDYSKWDHWEKATIHGGPRIVHSDFCMISDRPRVLTIDAESRPHNADGPFCKWSDNSAIYAWHGVRTPAKYYLNDLNAHELLTEPNVEVRRAMIERYDEYKGKGQFMIDAGAKVLDSAVQPMTPGQDDSINELISIELPDDPDGRMVALKVIDPSTGRQYVIRVPPSMRKVEEARAWSFNTDPSDFKLSAET